MSQKKHQQSHISLEGLRRLTGNEIHFRPIPAIWCRLMGQIVSAVTLQCLARKADKLAVPAHMEITRL